MSDEVELLHAGKHESLLQIDGMQMVKNSQSFQNSKFAISLQYLKKELKAEVDFFHAEFPKSLFQHLSLLMGMIKCFQITQTSLQYLCSISKKKLGMKIIFGMQIKVKVSTSWYYPF